MAARVTGVIAAVMEGIAKVTRGIASIGEGVMDFAYVKVVGLPFVVLGYRGTGKTTLIEYLRRSAEYLEDFDPEPTAAGGEPVPRFTTRLEGEGFRLRPRRDVGGEYAMWETDWASLFEQARPRGILFMLDGSDPYHHKDALNFVLNLIEDERGASRNLKAFALLVNKADLWAGERTLEDVLEDYRNETRRLKSQAERLGYQHLIAATSLKTGEGVPEAMAAFFNSIRPRSRPLEQPAGRSNGRGA